MEQYRAQLGRPLLTVGLIVKNEIRCLERCLKALRPLRDAIPCEVIVADTGSDDGSREVAEKYADIVFDFPWINDFAAARNAVMDRACGEWYLTVDADEYLDEDCTELVEYLTHRERWTYNVCAVLIRNYSSYDMLGSYSDFLAVRLVKMSTGVRYEGSIHEAWPLEQSSCYGQRKTILHHDGYVYATPEQADAKRRRNMELLEKELEKNPRSLKLLLQCAESSGIDEYLDYVRRAADAVEEKWEGWEVLGPIIFRHAVNTAANFHLPEFWPWVKRSEEWFPNSMFTRIEVDWQAFKACMREKKYGEAIRRGESYLKAVEDYHAGNLNPQELLFSVMAGVDPLQVNEGRTFLADAYFQEKQFEKARDMLRQVNGSELNAGGVANYIGILMNLYAQSWMDLEQTMLDFWEQISVERPDKEWAEQRRNALTAIAERGFSTAFLEEEDKQGRLRHAYQLYLPLAGESELGMAANVLDAEDPAEMERIIAGVKVWPRFPIHALSHALKQGIRFPVPEEKKMNLEDMDGLASRLSQDPDTIFELARTVSDEKGAGRRLLWKRGLMLAAARSCDWKKVEEGRGMEIAGMYARLEREFLPSAYAPSLLTEESVYMLPFMHRFGWYCAQAFGLLEQGNAVEYVRMLRKGLDSASVMKDMVEFLIDHTPQLRETAPAQEIQELADKVRTMLSAYAPDNPAVAVIRQSPAYQKVAYLIEGVKAPVIGGLAQ